MLTFHFWNSTRNNQLVFWKVKRCLSRAWCADGVRQSKSILEYKYRCGILIEPQPEAFILCRKRRQNSIVLNAFVSADIKKVYCLII